MHKFKYMLLLTRRRSLETLTVRGSVAFNQVEGTEKMTKIDTHLHVWASPEEVVSITFYQDEDRVETGT